MTPESALELGDPAAPPRTEPPEGLSLHPLVGLAGAFSLGIALERFLGVQPLAWLAGLVLLFLLGGGVWWIRARRPPGLLLLALFGCLGGQAMAEALFGQPANHLSRVTEAYLASPIPLEGWVVAPPEPRPAEGRDSGDPERTRFVLEVSRLRLGKTWLAANGRARLTVLGEPPEVAYGDEVRGTFRLRRPRRFDNPGAFDYPAYLATQGISLEGWTQEPVETVRASRGSALLGAVFRTRNLLLSRLDGAMRAPEAGLLKATVLGDRSGLSPEMNQAFLDSGTYHILAISGLNVSLLAGTLFGLLRLLRASPRLAAAASAMLVTLYAALAGGSASVVRAAVMADVYLLAVVLDRRADLLNSLALSALILLWWNPLFLFDVGFQLTFLATLGISLVLPRCAWALGHLRRIVRWPAESVVITVAATAMTLPILASAFNRVAPVGVLANLPIVPLSGLITALGTAASVFLLAMPAGLPWLNSVNEWLVDLLFGMARWFAAWPGSTVRVYTPTPGMLLAYYALLGAWLVGSPPGGTGVRDSGHADAGSRSPRRSVCRWLAVACGLALAVQVVLRLHLPEGAPRVRLTLLDVGQGEAIFLELPGKRRMLVDAGGVPGDRFDIGARVVAPFLLHEWVGHLDVLALTHGQADHIAGAPAILRSFSVGEVWTADAPSPSMTMLWVQEYLRIRRIPLRVLGVDSPPIRWGAATVEILYPRPRAVQGRGDAAALEPGSDNSSLVLRVRIGDQAALLTGDIERGAEETLLRARAPLQAQVLKVPHHGSRSSSTAAFIAAVRPQVALVSVGYRNRYRHPHPEIVERFQTSGVRLLRTDAQGAISVEMTPEGTRAWGRRADAQ